MYIFCVCVSLSPSPLGVNLKILLIFTLPRNHVKSETMNPNLTISSLNWTPGQMFLIMPTSGMFWISLMSHDNFYPRDGL